MEEKKIRKGSMEKWSNERSHLAVLFPDCFRWSLRCCCGCDSRPMVRLLEAMVAALASIGQVDVSLANMPKSMIKYIMLLCVRSLTE